MIYVRLPDVILGELCSQWISLRNLVNFDSSLTILSRKQFLQILSSDTVVFQFDEEICESSAFWLGVRGIKLSALRLNGCCSNDHRMNLSKVKKLYATPNQTASHIIDTINKCPVVESLCFRDLYECGLRDILPCISSNLLGQISDLSGVFDNETRLVGELCKNLTSLPMVDNQLKQSISSQNDLLFLVEQNPKLKILDIKSTISSEMTQKVLAAAPHCYD